MEGKFLTSRPWCSVTVRHRCQRSNNGVKHGGMNRTVRDLQFHDFYSEFFGLELVGVRLPSDDHWYGVDGPL